MSAIPFDILEQIVLCADFDTLKSLSLLNRDVNDVANRRLYRDVVVHIPATITDSSAACALLLSRGSALARDPYRLRWVQSLKIMVKPMLVDDEDEGPQEMQRSMGMMSRALANMVNLKELYIVPVHHNAEWARLLSAPDGQTPHFPNLETFESPIPHSSGLLPFFAHTPSITSYAISGRTAWACMRNFPPLHVKPTPTAQSSFPILPNLHIFSGTSKYLAHVLQSRPVHTIDIINSLSPRSEQDRENFIGGLQASTAPIQDLRIIVRVIDAADWDDFFVQLASLVSTSLKRFELFTPGGNSSNSDQTDEEAVEGFLNVLGLFEGSLEEISWWDSRANAVRGEGDEPGAENVDLVARCLEKCSSLKAIEINGDEGKGYAAYHLMVTSG